MKISYTMKRCWWGCWWNRQSLWRCTYAIIDPNHSTPQGQSTIFKRGDIIDLAFPVNNPAHPVYSNVQAAATVDSAHWDIRVNYDGTGVDFGPAYRVLYIARNDNAVLNNVNVYFVWNSQGMPGSQPWGFTNAGSISQHDELGQTIPA